MRAYVSSGGGVRIGATFGAVMEGWAQGKVSHRAFDYFLGTSAGALDAALAASGWAPDRRCHLFAQTDLGRLVSPFLPFSWRKPMALAKPMGLDRVAAWIDSLGLKPSPGLMVNAVDAETNTHVIFCQEVPPWGLGLKGVEWSIVDWGHAPIGKILARSMALPGLVADHPKWMDGGLAENPLLSVLPRSYTILMLNLGYPGLVKDKGSLIPQGVIERSFYAYDFKAATLARKLAEEFKHIYMIEPKVYDVPSVAFDIDQEARRRMITLGRINTKPQWEAIPEGLFWS